MHLLSEELRQRVAVLDVRGRELPAPGAFYPIADERYWRLVAEARTTTAVVWEGNQHNAHFLLADIPFAVVSRRASAPPSTRAQVVPYRMVRTHFEETVRELEQFLSAHPDPSSVLVVGTPPPKAERQVRAGLAHEEHFVRLLQQHDLTPDSAPVLDDRARVACWEALQDSMESIALRAGAAFLPVAHAAQNADGTLREAYCESDATHSNLAYGVLMWQEIVHRIEGV
jgi:hypothetical protein